LTDQGKVAYIFPGQGAQSVGMGQDIFATDDTARQVFHDADQVLGYSLSDMCFNGPEGDLTKTIHTQPAIVTTSLAYYQATANTLRERPDWQPAFTAGHSLGEYTALAVAGALDFQEAIWLVGERGRLMQEAGEKSGGGMGAVLGLDAISVEEVCQETGMEIANINSDDQIVISGPKDAMARALDMAKARGARKVIPLRVGGAFHSSLMESAVEGMKHAMKKVTLRQPTIPVIGNCTGKPLTKVEDIEAELLQQLCESVQWSQSVRYMAGQGVQTFLEIGPGRVLSGLVRRIESEAQTVNVGEAKALEKLAS
tara:strand:+ start:6753 stop:7688 length:936 start_codon:yes stop_codon:yes gene_type:complete